MFATDHPLGVVTRPANIFLSRTTNGELRRYIKDLGVPTYARNNSNLGLKRYAISWIEAIASNSLT
jgi:hypothetical protein